MTTLSRAIENDGVDSMNATEISKMEKIEKLQTMEAIWDSLIHEGESIESPEWHRDILENRKKKIEEGKAVFYSIEELRSKLRRSIMDGRGS